MKDMMNYIKGKDSAGKIQSVENSTRQEKNKDKNHEKERSRET